MPNLVGGSKVLEHPAQVLAPGEERARLVMDVCGKLRGWLCVSICMQEDQVGIEDDGAEAMHEEHSSREPEGPMPLVGSHPLARPFLF